MPDARTLTCILAGDRLWSLRGRPMARSCDLCPLTGCRNRCKSCMPMGPHVIIGWADRLPLHVRITLGCLGAPVGRCLAFRHLRPLTSGAATTVCSATQLLERLRGTRLTAGEVMVSFDVTSLFTSIPQDLAIETVSELLERQYDETDESAKRRHLVQLLKFCLKTYFTFEGTMYEQIKGTPMGSSLSGFIAEAVLQKLESLVFTTHRPKFWTRYVDDTFVIIKREMIEEFHSVLNSVFPDI
ncbi:Acyl-CoA synthetase member 2 mitochondrial [Sparganum proliferum]